MPLEGTIVTLLKAILDQLRRGGGTSSSVTVTSSALPTGASTSANQTTEINLLTALSKAEDSVHVSGDQGVQVLAVRNDGGSALAANGDYIPFTTDSAGSLRVAITSGAGSGGTSLAD